MSRQGRQLGSRHHTRTVRGAHTSYEIIAEGKADAVLLARAMLRDPYWIRHAAIALGAESHGPVQCSRA